MIENISSNVGAAKICLVKKKDLKNKVRRINLK